MFEKIGRTFFNVELPDFDLNKPSPYDQSSYAGRVRHFYSILDPRTLMTTSDQLSKYQQLLTDYSQKKKNGNGYRKEELWEAKRITSSIIHPDTQKPIPPLFRFSAFAAVNVPVCTLLLYPGSNALQIFAQVINQSYNVAINYQNRNASNPMSNQMLFTSYVAAISMSCVVAYGLRRTVATYGSKIAQSTFFRGFIPYSALTLASCFNVYFIRWNEITEGVSIKIKINETEMEELPIKSTFCGHLALSKCCLARALWSIPPMFFPPIIMKSVGRKVWFKKMAQWQKIAVESSVIGLVLLSSVPPALAIFPQTDSISGKYLEAPIKACAAEILSSTAADANIDADDLLFYFNKGL